jgi:zinc protease
MKKALFLLFSALLLVSGSTVSAKPPVLPESKPLEIQFPSFDATTLTCGLKVYFFRDTQRPLVSANLYIPGGYSIDPEGKEGMVGLLWDTMRDGGAGDLSAEAFDAALKNKSIDMNTSADQEHFSAGFHCLSEDLPYSLGLFADMLRRPRFDAKRLESSRAKTIDYLNRRQDKPEDITEVLFSRTLQGHNPYGRWATPNTLKKISRSDVVAFFKKHYGPNGAVLALAGNFDEKETTRLLEKFFADWPRQEVKTDFGTVKPLGPKIYFFPKEASQVSIRFGLLGYKNNDPDEMTYKVANYVLGGGGFASRLLTEIRSKRGLAYYTYSYFIPLRHIPGTFQIDGGTRPDATKEYLAQMFKIMDQYAKDGPTQKELDEAKKSIIENFAQKFESSFSASDQKAALLEAGYPEDFWDTYRVKINAVTQKQAQEAAEKILAQKDWVLVVSGPATLEKDLSAFGQVVKVTNVFQPLGD